MNWYRTAQQQYLWDNDPDLPAANATSKKEYWDLKYPRASKNVDGLTVLENVPNTDSISSSMYNYYIFPGIREIPISEFNTSKYYNVQDNRHCEQLAEQIKTSRQIKPLIVAIEEDAYILEGGHRLNALAMLGIKSFPALLVLDLSDSQGENNELV